jgi:FRG domain
MKTLTKDEGMSRAFTEIRVASWPDALSCLTELDPFHIFRGQSDAAWTLKTSIERCHFFGKNYRVEKDFLKDFQRGACTYLASLPAPDDTLSWLSLMQHHGAPTRLLDFTHSPYVATYFALENAVTDAAVWAIHSQHLKEDLAQKSPRSFQYRGDEWYDLSDEAFKQIFDDNELSCVFPVRPSVTNKRYMAQQALFVSLGNTNASFMDQLLSYSWPEYLAEHIVKIILPIALREEGLYDLSRMNINRAVLFPDLDGFSMHLKNTYELRYRGAWAVRSHVPTETAPPVDGIKS